MTPEQINDACEDLRRSMLDGTCVDAKRTLVVSAINAQMIKEKTTIEFIRIIHRYEKDILPDVTL